MAFRSLFISMAAVDSLDFASMRLKKGNKISECVKVLLEIAPGEARINTRESMVEKMNTILPLFWLSRPQMKSSANLDTAVWISFWGAASCGGLFRLLLRLGQQHTCECISITWRRNTYVCGNCEDHVCPTRRVLATSASTFANPRQLSVLSPFALFWHIFKGSQSSVVTSWLSEWISDSTILPPWFLDFFWEKLLSPGLQSSDVEWLSEPTQGGPFPEIPFRSVWFYPYTEKNIFVPNPCL